LANSADIVDIIETNPGIKFSEIMRETGLKNGVLSYQLRKLEESGSVKTERTPGTTRYYPLGMNDEESVVVKYLRQNTFRSIIILLCENPLLSFRNIVELSKFSSSSVSNTLSKLVSEGIVNMEFEKRKKLYRIDNKNIIKKMINGCNDTLHDVISKHDSTIKSILLIVLGLSQKFLFDQPIDYAMFDKLSLF